MLKLTLALLAVGASAMRVAQDDCDEPWEYDYCLGLFYQEDCDNGYDEHREEEICNINVSYEEDGSDSWWEECEDWWEE